MKWKCAGAILRLVEHNYLYFVFMWKVQYAKTTIYSVVEVEMARASTFAARSTGK